MNYNNYNTACLITSITMLFIITGNFYKVDLCVVLLLASLFSIIWRSTKLLRGKSIIEKNSKNDILTHPLFILDFMFALLGYFCIMYSRQISYKLILLTFTIFTLGWTLHYLDLSEASRSVHFSGHCTLIFIFILVFYFQFKQI